MWCGHTQNRKNSWQPTHHVNPSLHIIRSHAQPGHEAPKAPHFEMYLVLASVTFSFPFLWCQGFVKFLEPCMETEKLCILFQRIKTIDLFMKKRTLPQPLAWKSPLFKRCICKASWILSNCAYTVMVVGTGAAFIPAVRDRPQPSLPAVGCLQDPWEMLC